jgi:hypothetical protein
MYHSERFPVIRLELFDAEGEVIRIILYFGNHLLIDCLKT